MRGESHIAKNRYTAIEYAKLLSNRFTALEYAKLSTKALVWLKGSSINATRVICRTQGRQSLGGRGGQVPSHMALGEQIYNCYTVVSFSHIHFQQHQHTKYILWEMVFSNVSSNIQTIKIRQFHVKQLKNEVIDVN